MNERNVQTRNSHFYRRMQMYNGNRTILGIRIIIVFVIYTCRFTCAFTHDRSVSIIHLHSPIEMRISCLSSSHHHRLCYLHMQIYKYVRCIHMGRLRLVGSLKLYVSFAEHRLFYKALLQKRPIILRSLLVVATPYTQNSCIMKHL